MGLDEETWTRYHSTATRARSHSQETPQKLLCSQWSPHFWKETGASCSWTALLHICAWIFKHCVSVLPFTLCFSWSITWASGRAPVEQNMFSLFHSNCWRSMQDKYPQSDRQFRAAESNHEWAVTQSCRINSQSVVPGRLSVQGFCFGHRLHFLEVQKMWLLKMNEIPEMDDWTNFPGVVVDDHGQKPK